jgi:hypothetical protein
MDARWKGVPPGGARTRSNPFMAALGLMDAGGAATPASAGARRFPLIPEPYQSFSLVPGSTVALLVAFFLLCIRSLLLGRLP